ncbi:MAG: hypothetical protein ACPHRO_04840 [Nannocystaceae bacterium]
MSDSTESTEPKQALGKIALGQKEVSVREYDQHSDAAIRRRDPKEVGRLNRLVPYLDLFARLDDRELARLADVPQRTVVRMRQQVNSVRRKLDGYVELLDRLDDHQLGRIAQTSPKMFQYLRLCQPRGPNVTLKMPVRKPKFLSISNEQIEEEESKEGATASLEDAPIDASSAEDASIEEAAAEEAAPAEAEAEADEAEFEFSFIDDDDE